MFNYNIPPLGVKKKDAAFLGALFGFRFSGTNQQVTEPANHVLRISAMNPLGLPVKPSAVVAVVDAVLMRLVGEFAHGGLQDPGGIGDVAPGVFEGVDQHFFFEIGDSFL